MSIMGIDPGPRESAYVMWDGSRVLEQGDLANPHMRAFLEEIRDGHREQPDEIAIEWMECFGMPAGQPIFQTVFHIGSFASIVPMRLVPRRDVKLNLCRSSAAKDQNVRHALLDRFGPQGKKKSKGPLYGVGNHRWSALAIAVTAFDISRTKNEQLFHIDNLQPQESDFA